MKVTLAFLAVLALASGQRYSGSYGAYGSGFGSGGTIVFPTSRPTHNLPVRPGDYGSRPVGGFPAGTIINVGGGARPVGGFPAGTGSVGGFPSGTGSVGGFPSGTGSVGGFPSGTGSVGGFPSGTGSVGGFPSGTGSTGSQQNFGSCNPISTNPIVHSTFGSSQYHYSWCADGGQKYEWQPAVNYCSRLGPGWYGVSIEDQAENQFISQTVAAHDLTYIWTGAQRRGLNNWIWPSGNPFRGIAWSHTGLDGQPQPDNRENRAENCLAILNNFYNDGITWHDIACHHTKPIVCERPISTFG